MTNHIQEACDRYIKAYKKVEKLSKTIKNEENAPDIGNGKVSGRRIYKNFK